MYIYMCEFHVHVSSCMYVCLVASLVIVMWGVLHLKGKHRITAMFINNFKHKKANS